MNTPLSRHRLRIGSWTRMLLVWLGMVSALLLIGPREADAEGSAILMANGGDRPLTQWRYGKYGNLLPARTLFKVYANAGEKINLGSSAVNVGSGDIVVWTPGTITTPLAVNTSAPYFPAPPGFPAPSFSCKTAQGNTAGKMTTRAQELAGPLPNSNGYTPCVYPSTAAGVGVSASGVYYVAFYGPSGASTDTAGSAGTIAAPAITTSQNGGVSMFDITVRNNANTVTYNGRVFTDYLSQQTGGNGPSSRIYSTLYAVTSDGFKYQVDMRGLDPNAFILYGTTVGFRNSDGTTPLYHDLYDGSSDTLSSPRGGVTLAPPTGVLFLNPPDVNLPASVLPTPVVPSVNSITFQGTAGQNLYGDGIPSSFINTGGNFVYSGNVGGVAEVTLVPKPVSGSCATATYDPTVSTNRVLRAALASGVQNLAWDGKDNSGTNMPLSYPGYSSSLGYCYKATLHAGEYHFPLLDAENSMLGGPTITLLNAPGGACPFSSISPCRTAFFDDRGYRTLNGTTVGTVGSVLPGTNPPPSPYYSLTGFDTASTTIRKYGNDGSSGWGSKKGLDLWTYFPSPDVTGQLYVVPQGTADLAINKTHSGDFVIGSNNDYTLTVRNVGTGSIAGAITVTDPVPAGLTLVSAAGTGWNCAGTSGQNVNCTITPSGGLAGGASLNDITVTVNPTSGAATGSDITNTATVANSNDTNGANNSSSSPTTIASADLAVTKSASPTGPAEGATVTYTIMVTNDGPSNADAVSVADAVPAGLTFVSATPTQGSYASGTWSVGTLLESATATLTLVATVNPGQSGQTIGNTATVSGGPYDYASGNNTASASLSVPATVLTGIVTDQRTGLPLAGVSVQVTDNAAHTYTVTTDGDGRYTVTGSPANPLAAGAAAVSASAAGYATATASPTVVAGTTVTRNLTLTPLSLSGTLTTLGTGVPIVGATVTLTQDALTCTTTTTAGGAYSFVHSAGCLLVAGAATVSSSPTNYATASATPTILATGPTIQDLQAGTADLVITKTDGVATVEVGEVLSYVLTVVNNGSIAAEAVTLKDTFPSACLDFISDNSGITKTGTGTSADPYTWVKSGSLAPDVTWAFTITASVKTDVATNCPTGITNYAKVFTSSPENNGPNNEVSDIDTLAQRPDLVITKTDGVTQVQAGQTLSYAIAYQNTGNKAATAVTIVDTLLNGVEIDTAQLSGNTYNGSTPPSTYTAPSGDQPGTLTWTIGSLAVNGTGSITLSLKVKSDVAPGSVVANRVAMAHNETNDGADPNPGDNTATDSDLVTAPAIVLEKRVTGPTYVGQAVGYSIDWRNVGAATAKSVTITDTLPANTTLVGGSITGGGTLNGSVITWDLGDQATGASGSVGFQVIPNTSAGGAIQTAPTLTTETGSGSVTVTSSTTPLALPYCQTALAGTIAVTNGSAAVTGTGTAFATELAAGDRIAITGVLYQVLSVTDATHLTLTAAYAGATGSGITATNATCLALMNRYQGTDGTPPTGWNDNPRLTVFDDSAWTQAGEAEPEYPHWTQPDNLSAEWVAPNKDPHLVGNFTFFRQGFCLPLNATGLSARLELAGDDVSTIYLNGSGLGQQIGAGGANAFTDSTGIQAGMNVLAVQLLNNRHGGHPFPSCPGCDHIGLLFNLNAAYSGLRPFVAAPTAVLASESVTVPFTVSEAALGGIGPYAYTLTFGDGSDPVTQSSPSFSHLYNTPGTYTAMLTATDTTYGCTGSDEVIITVLPTTANLLANAATASYQDGYDHAFTASSGSGQDLAEAADLAITKGVTGGTGTVPGQGVTYQILVTNNGPNAATGATVTDTVPASVTGVAWTCVSSGGACAHASGGGNALAETVDLPAGATATYVIIGTVAPTATGTLANTATVAPPDGVTDLETDNNAYTASTSLTATLDLSITKTSSPTHALPGGDITYTITVHNAAGWSDAVGARVTDTLPDEIGLVTWSCSASSGSSCAASGAVKIDDTVNVKSGGTLTYTLTGVLDPSAAAPVQNTASVTAPAGTTDTNSGNNAATDTNTPTQIALTGVVRVNGTVQEGATVTVVDNAGHSYTTTTNTSGSYSFASTGENPLAIGVATITATYSTYVPKVENKTLTAGANTQDLFLASTELDLSVSLVSSPTPFVAGQSFTYTLVVSHLSGPPDGANTRVQSTLPAALSAFTWSCVADSGASCGATTSGSGNINALVNLPLGTKVTYSVTGTVPEGTTGTLTTSVTVTAPTDFTDPNEVNNSASDTNPPVPTYALADAFSAQVQANQVVVAWDTQIELGTQGFELARLDSAGEFQPLHEGLIAGQNPAGEGGNYRFLDPSAVPGVPAVYRLTEVERNGTRREVGQFPVIPLAPPATAQAKQTPQQAVTLAPGRAEFTPRPPTPAEIARVQARQAEREFTGDFGLRAKASGPATSAATPTNRAAIGVRATGLYQVSTSALAQALDWPEGKVKGLIQAGQLRLTNQGADIAWQAAAKDQGLRFYGQASRSIYDSENVYVVQQGAGTRMSETRVLAKGTPGAVGFSATVSAEENRFAGTVMAKDPEEDFWFWSSFKNGGTACDTQFLGCGSRAFPVVAPEATGTGPARLRLWLRGVSALPPNPDHQVRVSVNGTPVGDGQWDGLTDYLLDLSLDGSLLRADGQNQVQVEARVAAGVAYNYFYLDRLELEYQRQYHADQDALTATGGAGQLLVASGFATNAIQVFDLSDIRSPRVVTGAKIQSSNGSYQVSLVPASATTPYLLVTDGAMRAPARVRPMETTGLAGTQAGAKYLVIAPRDFYDEASQPVQRLLSLRSNQGLSGRFVSLQALYDDYGHGQKSPHALRRFLAEAVKTWKVPPAYVLLAGKGTFDPKDYLGYGTDRLPVLMALTPDSGVIAADQRFVDVDGNSFGDLALGRLPAATAAEFAGMVDKLIAYEDGGPSPVPHAILLADGPDAGGNYTRHSEASADRLLAAGLQDADIQRLYLERMSAAAARTALLAGLNSGADLLNYFGHAGVTALDHNLLTVADGGSLTEPGQWPVMLGMTCLVNRFEFPQLISLGEALLRNPAGGAAAVWSSGGYSYDAKASALNDAVLEALLQQRVPRLGDAIQAALSGTINTVGLATAPGLYNLLGDPATINLLH